MVEKSNVNKMVKIAILAALAYIIMFFEIPLWFAPPFYKIDLSEVIVLIGAFALGPIEAIIIEALKIVLNLIFSGTNTAFIGEIANFIMGISFVLPAAIIYKQNKNRTNAIIGMTIGTILLVIIGTFMNYFILIPAYSKFYGLSIESIIQMGNLANKSVDSILKLVLLCVAPFNLVKGLLTSIIVAIIYKNVSPILH